MWNGLIGFRILEYGREGLGRMWVGESYMPGECVCVCVCVCVCERVSECVWMYTCVNRMYV